MCLMSSLRWPSTANLLRSHESLDVSVLCTPTLSLQRFAGGCILRAINHAPLKVSPLTFKGFRDFEKIISGRAEL